MDRLAACSSRQASSPVSPSITITSANDAADPAAVDQHMGDCLKRYATKARVTGDPRDAIDPQLAINRPRGVCVSVGFMGPMPTTTRRNPRITRTNANQPDAGINGHSGTNGAMR